MAVRRSMPDYTAPMPADFTVPGTNVEIVALGRMEGEGALAKVAGKRCVIVNAKDEGEWASGRVRCPDGEHLYDMMKVVVLPPLQPPVAFGQSVWLRALLDSDPNAEHAMDLIRRSCVVGEGRYDARGWWAGKARGV